MPAIDTSDLIVAALSLVGGWVLSLFPASSWIVRKLRGPKLRLHIDANEGCDLRTPTADGSMARYFRVCVVNEKPHVATGAVAYLIGVKRYNPTTRYFDDGVNFTDTIPLNWSYRVNDPAPEPIIIPYNVPLFIDVITVVSEGNAQGQSPRLAVSRWPLLYERILEQPGKYLLEVAVIADEWISERYGFVFEHDQQQCTIRPYRPGQDADPR